MGLFDSVMVPCPNCGNKVEFQSKADDPGMKRYSLEDAPPCILNDIINAPEYCRGCDQWFALIDPRYPPGEMPKPDLRPAMVKTPQGIVVHTSWRWWPDNHPFTYADLA